MEASSANVVRNRYTHIKYTIQVSNLVCFLCRPLYSTLHGGKFGVLLCIARFTMQRNVRCMPLADYMNLGMSTNISL